MAVLLAFTAAHAHADGLSNGKTPPSLASLLPAEAGRTPQSLPDPTMTPAPDSADAAPRAVDVAQAGASSDMQAGRRPASPDSGAVNTAHPARASRLPPSEITASTSTSTSAAAPQAVEFNSQFLTGSGAANV
ncbi:MAG: fimbrial biogenesis outer membrane usher protein, partial [Burkholderia sp.]|nr:fimbrial biogenesis outer membrane usher protein [Burkholderia sp.]